MMRNIYLIGFMGVGKSTVGKILAERLKRDFYDTDELIEACAGCSIPEIFARWGEPRFRELEEEAVAEVANRNGLVVALGGGAPLREENWRLISRSGVTVYLKEAEEVLFFRLMEDSGRPLLASLKGSERLARIRELLSAREPYYLRSDIVVECRGRPPREIAEEILGRLEHDHC